MVKIFKSVSNIGFEGFYSFILYDLSIFIMQI